MTRVSVVKGTYAKDSQNDHDKFAHGNIVIPVMTLLAAICLFSCSEAQQPYYHGYVYDEVTRKPLKNVLVKENTPGNPKFTRTDAKGYFKIENNTQFFADLIFSDARHSSDTIPTAWSQHGEKMNFTFVTSRPDTTFLRAKIKL